MFSNKTSRNILILFVFPSLILSISLIFSCAVGIANSKFQIKQNCNNSLSLFSQMCETEISATIRSVSYLYHSEALMNYLRGKSSLSENGVQYSVTSALAQFKESNDIIYEIFVLDKLSDKVISSDGVFSLRYFFDNMCSYQNYSAEYWQQFAFFGHPSQLILSPSFLDEHENRCAVIPIVFNSLGSIKISKFLVVSISLDALFSKNSAAKITDGSDVFILSRFTGDIFGQTDKYKFGNVLDTDFYTRLVSSKSSFDKTLNGHKALIVSHSFSDNLLGFTYFAAIPYRDIYKMQSYLLICSGIIYVIFLFAAIYTSTKNARKVIDPLQSIAGAFSPGARGAGNMFEFINTSIADLQQKNDDISKALPLAGEKYLISFLNSADLYIDKTTREIVEASLPFRNDYFASVIFQVFPKKAFFEDFSLSEYDNIFAGLYKIIKNMFSESFDSFFLSSERETLCIILNSDENYSSEKIDELLNEIYTFVKNDNEYISIYTGVGSFGKRLAGLRRSYREAAASLKSVSFGASKTPVGTDAAPDYILSDANETKLYNAVIAFDTELAKKLIGEYTRNISDSHLLRHLYTQIINTIFRAMRAKGMLDAELLDEYISATGKSSEAIYRYILKLLSAADAYKSAADSSSGSYEIIEYIKKNYRDSSLSLESLATLFNVTSGYISQLIKKNIGIGFHEYLSSLRISCAKELLINTDKGIREIYEESGFFSKPTFFRIFKASVGMTPNEYRKSNK